MGAHRNFSMEGQRLGDMASAERDPISGLWGGVPSGVQRESPWSGVRGPLLKLKALKHLHS